MQITTLGDTRDLKLTVSGLKYQTGYRASVIGILGGKAPRVSSRGSRFYNRDRWTTRKFISFMCEWAKANPGCQPVYGHVADWVSKANKEVVAESEREIVIANTPEVLPLRTAMALTGGAYHEALHTYFTARRNLTAREMADIVLPRWAKVKDWSRYLMALLNWTNIIEDVRIERRGCEEFEGIHVKMCDLQDFIIKQEEQGEQSVRSHGGKPSALSIVERAFRDFGLGYNTTIQRDAIARYYQDNTEAVDLVTDGPLAPYLSDTINMTASDDTGHLLVAMDVIAKLAEMGGQDDPEDKSKDGETGDGKTQCPSCGAPAGNLIVRPMAGPNGTKVPGKGIVTCTVCGHQEEVDIEKKPAGAPGDKKGKPEAGPKFEGFTKEDLPKDPGQGGKGEKGGKDEKGEKGQGEGEDKDEESSDKGGGGASGKDEPADDLPPEDGGPSSDEGEGSGGPPGTGGGKPLVGDEDDGTGEKGGKGAGGHHEDKKDLEGHDWSNLAAQALKDGNKDVGVLDGNSALEQSVGVAQTKEDKDTKVGEAPWAPYDPGLDHVAVVKPSSKGIAADTLGADQIITSVKAEIGFLRSRLRTVLRSMEQTHISHGVPKGRELSGHFLVDTKVSVMARENPRRAYTQRDDKLDLTMSAAIVLDQSGSMSGELETATRIMVAITEPLDNLGVPVLVLGFRDGAGARTRTPGDVGDKRRYHRYNGINHDIFKGWNEKFRTVRWRFANTRAGGGTPMADGIQYALMALSPRKEAHRFLFVVTDGMPMASHLPVINRQVRLAKQAGIHLIGVGIGHGATCVKTLFPDHVWSNTIKEFPKLLVAKLNELVDVRAIGRGRKVAK